MLGLIEKLAKRTLKRPTTYGVVFAAEKPEYQDGKLVKGGLVRVNVKDDAIVLDSTALGIEAVLKAVYDAAKTRRSLQALV